MDARLNLQNVPAQTMALAAPQPKAEAARAGSGDELIRDELKKYAEHKDVTCLECGYRGLMGIVPGKAIRPWYLDYPGVCLFFLLFPPSILVAFILALVRQAAAKHYVVCPNCRKILGPV